MKKKRSCEIKILLRTDLCKLRVIIVRFDRAFYGVSRFFGLSTKLGINEASQLRSASGSCPGPLTYPPAMVSRK